MSSVMSRTANALPPAVRSAKSTSAPVGWICPAAIASRTRSDGRRKDDQSYLCRVLRGRYRAAETRLRGWPCRTRSRKCRFFVISGELLGFTEHFRTRDFSRTPRRDRCKSRWVKATFASSSPICPATQSGLHRYLPERLQGQWRRVANFNYADPIIAGWGPLVIVSFAGGLVLLASALLFLPNLAVLHRSPLPAPWRPLYPLAVNPPQRVPAPPTGFGPGMGL